MSVSEGEGLVGIVEELKRENDTQAMEDIATPPNPAIAPAKQLGIFALPLALVPLTATTSNRPYELRSPFPLLHAISFAAARLRNLILAFGTYRSPPSLLSAPMLPAFIWVAPEIITSTQRRSKPDAAVGESLSNEEDQLPDDDDAMSLDGDFGHRSIIGCFLNLPPDIVSHAPGDSTPGALVIPGWGGDVDENSVAEVILDAPLKVPVDLRKDLVSSILVVGGTAILPWFIPRLHTELARPLYDPYAPLRPPAPFISVLSNPMPPLTASSILARANAENAPAFAPVILPALIPGGEEILRKRWDKAFEKSLEPPLSPPPAAVGQQDGSGGRRTGRRYVDILPDWTRIPLGVEAPSVALDLSSAPPPGTPV
ncbi:hypothetical protein BOTBODRAFT_177963 [Botryobasidium botryosum FD-172 SS1]|uniref:Uncharacterized protein n=1 Tax=Botryobasidium botryosum (strain FD-172 SS1) TaxID=930990 RepID=A0A067MFK9_BOTB1|nr:hypothetical protein BOTBODRAFT_177963 [Botryobasidium botryosum FD-172 SS1]